MKKEEVDYTEEELKEVEAALEELSLQLIDILNRYKTNNVITEEEYDAHTRIKRNFLEHLKNKRKNQDE